MNNSFEYSEFQKIAIQSIHDGNHTLITAHTGSGKTLPAEYAIEYFTQNGKKVIYTSPIKALSNQKYNDFTKKFPHLTIGLLTGDNKHNPSADVLIMTTEILQNNLFNKRQSLPLDFAIDMDNDLACVVFDEVHYIDDAERGTVWEQSMILLPNHVQFIMLSATIGEKEKFAGWIERIKEKKVVICGTNERVVPLHFYSFFTSHHKAYEKLSVQQKMFLEPKLNKLELIKDHIGYKENTLTLNKKCIELVKDAKINKKFVINEVCKVMREKEMFPALFFVFSRKNVEEIAHEITFPLFEEGEKDYEIGNVCKQMIVSKVTNWKEYIMLPEYENYMKLLNKGIGIHHAGMLPIFREMIEVLYEKRYIKVLVATETFAIGLNMPTKTVCYTSLYKYDTKLRPLYPHEFIQMSGRAGRRNIDTIGHVILLTNLYEPLESTAYYKLFNSTPKVLKSKFKISYDLALQIKNEDDICKFIEKSMMYEDIIADIHYNKKIVSELEVELKKQESETALNDITISKCKKYIQLKEDLSISKNKARRQILNEISEIENNEFMYQFSIYNKLQQLYKDIVEYNDYVYYCEHYVERKVSGLFQVLEENSFIYRSPDNIISLTDKGMIAVNIHEIHPLIYTDLYCYNNFIPLSATDLFCLLSCFYPTKGIEITPPFLKEELKFIKVRMEYYEDQDQKYEFVNQYVLQYDLMPFIKEWMDECDDEIKSVKLLNKIKQNQLFCGDFIKCCLKLVNISKEIEKNAPPDLKEKLEEGKSKIMKFICTNQSLYL
uniref:Helicase n=1 Tax=viral metagenome TaxID=1070528 RepID=A0A6C0D2M0_9ZZZZ